MLAAAPDFRFISYCYALISRCLGWKIRPDDLRSTLPRQAARAFSFSSGGLKVLLEQDRLSFTIEADFTLSDAVVKVVNKQIREQRRTAEDQAAGADTEPASGPIRERDLRYRIEIEMLPKSGVLRVAAEYLAALNKKGEPTASRSLFTSCRSARRRGPPARPPGVVVGPIPPRPGAPRHAPPAPRP